ncbi:MAG: 50S ribosomal protein L9 [bacterium]|nr:50S ribosomal protein L9 [bacterium]
MKVVLIQNIDKIGKAFEIKEVADGYAQNFLLPRGLAQIATPQNLLIVEARKKTLQNKDKQARKERAQAAKKLEGLKVIIKEKVQDNGVLYGSVNQTKIADVLKKSGFMVEKEQVVLKNSLKETGEFSVEINFSQNIKAKIKVIIQKSE